MKPIVNNINCGSCKNNCCGAIPNLIPVLLPEEESEYLLKDRHETPYGPLWTLKKQENGSCIYLSDDQKCLNYMDRPLECRLYPYLLDFSNDVGVKLDTRYCSNSSMAIKPELCMDLPKTWIMAYLHMSPKFNGV